MATGLLSGGINSRQDETFIEISISFLLNFLFAPLGLYLIPQWLDLPLAHVGILPFSLEVGKGEETTNYQECIKDRYND